MYFDQQANILVHMRGKCEDREELREWVAELCLERERKVANNLEHSEQNKYKKKAVHHHLSSQPNKSEAFLEVH